MMAVDNERLGSMKILSPRRHTSEAASLDALVDEQLAHFGIDPKTEYGTTMAKVAKRLYENQHDVNVLWKLTLDSLNQLEHSDQMQRFNAKKFLCFQLAKVLDTLQHPFRKNYQSLGYVQDTVASNCLLYTSPSPRDRG